MKKAIIFSLALSLALLLSACIPSDFENVDDTPDPNLPAPTTKEELYSLYDVVDRGMTKADVDALLGEGEPMLDDYGDVKYYNYYNDSKSAGVTVIYDFDGVILSKTLYFNTKKNLIPFSGRFDHDKVELIKSDMSVASASEVMGSAPLELACTYRPDGPLSMDKRYCWYNKDGSNFMLHTENDVIKNVALYQS